MIESRNVPWQRDWWHTLANRARYVLIQYNRFIELRWQVSFHELHAALLQWDTLHSMLRDINAARGNRAKIQSAEEKYRQRFPVSEAEL